MFYDKFKLLCDQKGVSCNRAATDMGLSNSTPTKWKKTGATPDGATLSKISSYFGVSVGDLLTNDSTGSIEFTVSSGELREYMQSKKAPADIGKRSISDDDIKFALFGGDGEITDSMYEEVRNFAAYVKQREANKKKE